MDKQIVVHQTVKYYYPEIQQLKRTLDIYAIILMNLKSFMLSESGQSQKAAYCILYDSIYMRQIRSVVARGCGKVEDCSQRAVKELVIMKTFHLFLVVAAVILSKLVQLHLKGWILLYTDKYRGGEDPSKKQFQF